MATRYASYALTMHGVKMRRADLLLVFIGALMLALSRLPLHLGWLVFFAWIPYLHIFERGDSKPMQMLRFGFITSVVYVLIVFRWIGIVTVPGLFGMVALFTLVYFLLFSAIQRTYRALPYWRYPAFIAWIITFEYVQNYGETHFPWFNIGYSLADYNILVQAADLIGLAGLGILIIIVNILIYRLLPGNHRWLQGGTNLWRNVRHSFKSPRTIAFLALILVFACWFGYGYYALHNTKLEKHDAGIFVMQPAIDQDVKWEAEQYYKSMALFRRLTTQAAADSAKLIIYPEGAVTNYLLRTPQVQSDLRSIVEDTGVEVFTGFPDAVPAPAEHINTELYYNAASLFKPDQFYNEVYYKNILVPVGERMLWLDQFPFMWKMQFGQANWEFGKKLSYFESGGYTFSPSICYELAFPDIFQRMSIPRDSLTGSYNKCDYLVNITNDGWFGTSYGLWLHAAMVRFRAVENRIQIYRSANTGISLIVDPLGRVLTKTELLKVTNITAPLYTTPKIPLIRKIRFYPLLIVAFAICITLLSFLRRTEKHI